jgi:hypothetical protein
MTDEPNAPTGQAGQTAAEPQQPAGDAPDGAKTDTSQDSVSRAELDKAIARRQDALKRAQDAEARLVEMHTSLTNMPSEEDLTLLAETKAKRAEAARNKALKEGDADAIAAQAAKEAQAPLIGKVTQLEDRLAKRDEQLAKVLRDDALLKAAVTAGAVNPQQVVELLRPRIKMAEQPDGTFGVVPLSPSGLPLQDAEGLVTDVNRFVTGYLSDPLNANLVKATATHGSGAKPSGGSPAPPDGKPRTLDEFNALPEDQRAAVAVSMTKAERHAMFGIGPKASQGFL